MGHYGSTETWVLVCDSGHAKLFYNRGGNDSVHEEGDIEVDIPKTKDIMAGDRGREKAFNDASQRHAFAPPTDPRTLEKVRFVKGIAEIINKNAEKINRLVVAAPPKSLSVLRKELSEQVKGKIIAEIDKDLTHSDERSLPQHLKDHMNIRDPLHEFDYARAQMFSAT